MLARVLSDNRLLVLCAYNKCAYSCAKMSAVQRNLWLEGAKYIFTLEVIFNVGICVKWVELLILN